MALKYSGKAFKTVVISLGGSIIVPEGIDIPFLKRFKKGILDLTDHRFILVCGGGKICRNYQNAAREAAEISGADLDWIGIMATRLNAELVRATFGKHAYKKVIYDPDEAIDTSKQVIIGAGFEPGSSTDLRVVQLARRFEADTVINMSNIDYVYITDPNKDPNAERIENITWPEFRKIVGEKWDPGLSMPFDPIASREAYRLGLDVVIIGNDLDNLEKLLAGDAFKGTTISPALSGAYVTPRS